MSGIMKRRMYRALLVLGMAVAVGLALSAAEAWFGQANSAQLPLAIGAQEMAEAVLGGSVDEMVAAYGGTSLKVSAASAPDASDGALQMGDAVHKAAADQSAEGEQGVGLGPGAGTDWAIDGVQANTVDGLPPWLAEVMAGLENPSQVLLGQDGALVSLCWHQGSGHGATLAKLLEAAGWQRVESGFGGCCTYTRMKGEGEWLMVTEWDNANGTIVLARYV